MIIKQRIQRADGSIKYRQYLKQEKLGKGGFAQCFVVERISDKKKYALKVISKKLLEKPKQRQKMLSQIKLHRGAKHKNICQLERAFEDQQNVYMLLQLCSNGNMFEMIRRRKKLTIPEAQYYIYQLIDALCYLHNRQMIHRDVKLGNLLIDSNMNLKLADFGLTTKLQFKGDRKHTVCGTPNYIAPQIIRSGMGLGASGHSFQVDIWSTGVILYLMMVGRAPFETAVVDKTYQRISKAQFSFPDNFKDHDAKDLIRKILVVDPAKRYTFQQILNHPFMNPKCGIPKQLPGICYSQAPKFGVFQKYAQDPVKQSARNASVMTLRSSVQLSMQQQFDGFNSAKNDQMIRDSINTSRSRDSKRGLLKHVFSTTSLNKSLQKLDDLNRSTSVNRFSRVENRAGGMNSSRVSLNSNGLYRSSHFSSATNIENQELQLKKAQLGYVYILAYRHEAVWNYLLSNGYSGTYEANYKILFNRSQNIYFEIAAQNNNEVKQIKKAEQIINEKLNNRRKFLKNYETHPLQCEPFISKSRLIYLSKIYKVQAQRILLFKLSNGNIQAHEYETNRHLLITQQDILMLEIDQGREIRRIINKKDKYDTFPNEMLDLYLKVKKLMATIASRNQAPNKPSH